MRWSILILGLMAFGCAPDPFARTKDLVDAQYEYKTYTFELMKKSAFTTETGQRVPVICGSLFWPDPLGEKRSLDIRSFYHVEGTDEIEWNDGPKEFHDVERFADALRVQTHYEQACDGLEPDYAADAESVKKWADLKKRAASIEPISRLSKRLNESGQ